MRIAILLLAASAASCAPLTSSDCARNPIAFHVIRAQIQQGAAGTVVESSGNLMPGSSCPSGTVEPVSRTVLVYPLLTQSQVTRSDASSTLFTSVAAQPVDSTQSGADGHFEVALAPGRYTLLVREGAYLFANHFDASGAVNPVEVAPAQVAQTVIDINYRAAY